MKRVDIKGWPIMLSQWNPTRQYKWFKSKPINSREIGPLNQYIITVYIWSKWCLRFLFVWDTSEIHIQNLFCKPLCWIILLFKTTIHFGIHFDFLVKLGSAMRLKNWLSQNDDLAKHWHLRKKHLAIKRFNVLETLFFIS